jgi:tetratricopeptide (TPR) repeat protein
MRRQIMRHVLQRNLSALLLASITMGAAGGSGATTLDIDELFDAVPATPPATVTRVSIGRELAERLRSVLTDASEALFSGRFEEAERLAREVTVLAPDVPEGWHLVGLALANVNDFDGAVEALGRAGDLYDLNAEPYVVQGDILLATGDTEAALAAFERAVAQDPGNWRAFEGVSRARAALGDAEGVREALAGAVEALGSADEGGAGLGPRVELSQALARIGERDAALRLLSDYAAAHPTEGEAHLMLGRMQIVADDYDAAARSLGRAVDLSDDPVPALLALATAEERRGNPEAAREALLLVRERTPSLPLVHIRLGEVAMAADQPETAVGHFQEAIDVAGGDALEADARLRLAAAHLLSGAPSEVEATLAPLGEAADVDAALAVRALAALALGNADGAFALLDRAQTETPYLEVADVMIGDEGYDLAERVLVAARDAYPDAVEPLARLGRLYGALRRYDEGLATFEAALDRAPGRADLERGAMLIAYRTGDLAGARSRAERLVASDPVDAQDLVWLATFASSEGDIDTARDAYEQAIEVQPDNWIALNNLASLITGDDPARAAALAGRAAELAPAVAAVQHTLGWALYADGDLSAAEAVYRSLAEAEPEVARTAYRLGLILIDRGAQSEGEAQLRRALDLDPEFEYAADARSRLRDQ